MKKFTEAEKQAYKRGRIVGYYVRKRQEARFKDKSSQKQKVKYGNFDANDAFKKALERSYRKDK